MRPTYVRGLLSSLATPAGEIVKTYRVDVSPNMFGKGSCCVSRCHNWGDISVTFRDTAAIACSDGHVLPAAISLVRIGIRRNVARFRVQTCVVRYERVETVLNTSEPIDGPAAGSMQRKLSYD